MKLRKRYLPVAAVLGAAVAIGRRPRSPPPRPKRSSKSTKTVSSLIGRAGRPRDRASRPRRSRSQAAARSPSPIARPPRTSPGAAPHRRANRQCPSHRRRRRRAGKESARSQHRAPTTSKARPSSTTESTTTPNMKSWSKLRPRPRRAQPAKAAQKAARPRVPPRRVPPQPAKARRDRRYPVLPGSVQANGVAPSRAPSMYQRPVPETASRSISLPPQHRWRRPGTQHRWSGDS